MLRPAELAANFGEGADAETVAAAEYELGVPLPPSYRRVVEEFGTFDLAGEEFLGIYRVPGGGGQPLGAVSETMDARAEYGMPSGLIAVLLDGMGEILVLESTRVDQEGEYPVFTWHPGNVARESMEQIGDDFGSFALRRCREAVNRWRELSSFHEC